MLFADGVITSVMGLSIPLLAISIGIFAVLSTNWRKAKVAEYRAILVQGMLDKGFAPSEIERVLLANDGGMEGAHRAYRRCREACGSR